MGFLEDVLKAAQAKKEEERKAAEAKKKEEEKEARKEHRKTIIIWIFGTLFIAALFFYIGFEQEINDYVVNFIHPKPEDKISKLIEEREYVEARSKLGSYDSEEITREERCDLLERISRAQIADLVFQGNFDMAAQIANEDKDINGNSFYYRVYYECVFEQGEEKLLYALSSISYPVNEEDDGYIKYSNSRLESFCDYLKASDKEFLIPKIIVFLRQEYKRDENGSYKEDFSDQKRIKEKFGVK